MEIPCRALPSNQMGLRIARARTQPPRASCGSIDPDSRMGTSSEIMARGAPTAVMTQVSTVLGLLRASPRLVRVWAMR